MLFSAAFKIGKKKLTFTFTNIENLEKFCHRVQQEFPDKMFYIFNRTKPTPAPKGYMPRGSKMWCPYCAAERKFIKWSTNPKKYSCCEVCGILDANWNVRKENGLWESVTYNEEGELVVRKRGRSRKVKKKKGAKK